jgi:hypothetical protein
MKAKSIQTNSQQISMRESAFDHSNSGNTGGYRQLNLTKVRATNKQHLLTHNSILEDSYYSIDNSNYIMWPWKHSHHLYRSIFLQKLTKTTVESNMYLVMYIKT